MRTLNVKVQSDHLSKLASVKSPAQALCELIWNGLDADAQKVIVTYKYNTLNAINEISIEDDGHGIFANEADAAFENLGGSWKKHAVKTRTKKRLLHGQEGRGRFKVFALGSTATWTTVYMDGLQPYSYTISGNSDYMTFLELKQGLLFQI